MKKRFFATMLALPLVASYANAQETSNGPAVKISGFGTGALTMTNTDDAEFARANQARGVKKDARTGVDSNLGLQADVAINSWLSVTGQGLVRKDADDAYGAEATLAFAKARLNDELSIRVGRLGAPIFMISEYRNVGYANPFVRPPQEMYSQVPFNGIDGIDAVWQRAFGDTQFTGQLSYGSISNDVSGGQKVRVKKLVALNLVAEHGPFTMRFGHAQGKASIPSVGSIATLLTSLRTTGAGYRLPVLNTLADDLILEDKKATFTSLGLAMDWNNIIAQSEYAKRKTDSFLADTTSWYVMGGYRIGKLLPYYIHAKVGVDGRVANTVPATCPAGYPAACTPTLRALSAGVDSLRTGGGGEQSTNSLGLRWDLYSSVDVKFQVDRITPKNGRGLFLNATPGFNHAVTVGTVAVDFIF
jgi:hypothetical protein